MSRLAVFSTPGELRAAVRQLRSAGKRVGLVPTMGALHAGHLSLVEAARRECDATIATIYVNPSQFGPAEDLGRYPRTLEADLDALAKAEADIAFVPADGVIYPPGFSTWVDVEQVGARWEGEHRPGHFRGVATVVLKLMNLAAADIAYFGQKDYQQTAVIRRMVADLNVPVEIRIGATVREPDGLAMSSRNVYLDPQARGRAVCLWQSLQAARRLVGQGERDAEKVGLAVRHVLAQSVDQIDYVAVADPSTLEPVAQIAGRTLVAIAVRIGPVRLIDNELLEPASV